MNMSRINNIIEALSRHEDEKEAVRVLKEIGTNSPIDEVREKTAQALIKRNTHDSLVVALIEKGKGIHDLSTRVAMSAINEVLALEDKSEAIKILEDTMNLHSDETVRDTARSVRALVEFSR